MIFLKLSEILAKDYYTISPLSNTGMVLGINAKHSSFTKGITLNELDNEYKFNIDKEGKIKSYSNHFLCLDRSSGKFRGCHQRSSDNSSFKIKFLQPPYSKNTVMIYLGVEPISHNGIFDSNTQSKTLKIGNDLSQPKDQNIDFLFVLKKYNSNNNNEQEINVRTLPL
ncbi:hypothetical protein HERIO_821 [Hepatospora eriocheir]|uniref:Uncharacterized protein n=1 Tax=Hepatospora eriocheir TaxID=1081669 RepID=A0A1X0QBZ2_9MICR|nr:hypothetical protein HERIO_821 [Hepatospora eriocheir]